MTRSIPELTSALRAVITGLEVAEWNPLTAAGVLKPIAEDLETICQESEPFGVNSAIFFPVSDELPELLSGDSRRVLTESTL